MTGYFHQNMVVVGQCTGNLSGCERDRAGKTTFPFSRTVLLRLRDCRNRRLERFYDPVLIDLAADRS